MVTITCSQVASIPQKPQQSLTQSFQENVENQSMSMVHDHKENFSKKDLMGFMMKQQMIHDKEADEAFDHQRRKAEILRRFHEMLLNHV